MSKSERVTAAHERTIGQLVGECRELGDDTDAWQLHLIGGLRRLTGARIGVVSTPPAGVYPDCFASESKGVGIAAPPILAASTSVAGEWVSDASRDRWLGWLRNPNFTGAFRSNPALARFFELPGDSLTCVRQDYILDREWFRSKFVNETLRPDGMVEGLLSRTVSAATGEMVLLVATRSAGDRPFPGRSARVVHRLHQELALHYCRSLWLGSQPNVSHLSPRLRQVLQALLDGDSEKHAALRLGLSQTTVHDHVKRLYRHFEVNSRAELLAYFLRRYRNRPTPS